jgi:hypothetical protein
MYVCRPPLYKVLALSPLTLDRSYSYSTILYSMILLFICDDTIFNDSIIHISRILLFICNDTIEQKRKHNWRKRDRAQVKTNPGLFDP